MFHEANYEMRIIQNSVLNARIYVKHLTHLKVIKCFVESCKITIITIHAVFNENYARGVRVFKTV